MLKPISMILASVLISVVTVNALQVDEIPHNVIYFTGLNLTMVECRLWTISWTVQHLAGFLLVSLVMRKYGLSTLHFQSGHHTSCGALAATIDSFDPCMQVCLLVGCELELA